MIAESLVPGIAIPSIIKGLSRMRASGVLICQIENCEKRVTFWQGRVTGASSNLIDDRMGEIIYRCGIISIDNFVEAAAKVGNRTRFGEALIRSGVFNQLNLWDSLNLQSRGILASLCFYKDLKIYFEKQEYPPRSEFLLQFDVDNLLESASIEATAVGIFNALCEVKPRLEIDPAGVVLADNDFLKDLVGLVEKEGNFGALVNRESRLSPIYTIRALFELYSKGILKDTLGYSRHVVCQETINLLSGIVENVNFMFAELKASAISDAIETWETIVGYADMALRRNLGPGIFVHPEQGFLFENILRAFVCQNSAREWVTNYVSPNRWVDIVTDAIHDIMYGAVLQIIFELQNKKPNSQELERARVIVNKMRYPEAMVALC